MNSAISHALTLAHITVGLSESPYGTSLPTVTLEWPMSVYDRPTLRAMQAATLYTAACVGVALEDEGCWPAVADTQRYLVTIEPVSGAFEEVSDIIEMTRATVEMMVHDLRA